MKSRLQLLHSATGFIGHPRKQRAPIWSWLWYLSMCFGWYFHRAAVIFVNIPVVLSRADYSVVWDTAVSICIFSDLRNVETATRHSFWDLAEHISCCIYNRLQGFIRAGSYICCTSLHFLFVAFCLYSHVRPIGCTWRSHHRGSVQRAQPACNHPCARTCYCVVTVHIDIRNQISARSVGGTIFSGLGMRLR
jgi:hypothetical protein